MIWVHPFRDLARILVEPAVMETILSFRQDAMHKTEAGGILLGYRRGDHLHIVEATCPQTADRRSLFRFFRCDRYHLNTAIKRWQDSDSKIDYLGEWHTHPETFPSPSYIDLSEWRKISDRVLIPMVFMIVGMDGSLWLGVGEREIIQAADRE
ncbi:hypothetical protein FFI39_015330 [Janthinobacterium sp. KBS0711]|uniref:Mov34/MPN/PAD-1 family protein n=1 Tax=Janthinobacterium sp. KBS0711 TaxID=1649647 RepID=UPI0009E1DD60|nr:hypothetical protein FFI39_015330 [Janthinobacterium sp. KBS0711]